MTIETGKCLLCLQPFVESDKRNPSRRTSGLAHKDLGADGSPEPREHALHILLGHGLGEPTDVHVEVFDDL